MTTSRHHTRPAASAKRGNVADIESPEAFAWRLQYVADPYNGDVAEWIRKRDAAIRADEREACARLLDDIAAQEKIELQHVRDEVSRILHDAMEALRKVII